MEREERKRESEREREREREEGSIERERGGEGGGRERGREGGREIEMGVPCSSQYTHNSSLMPLLLNMCLFTSWQHCYIT